MKTLFIILFVLPIVMLMMSCTDDLEPAQNSEYCTGLYTQIYNKDVEIDKMIEEAGVTEEVYREYDSIRTLIQKYQKECNTKDGEYLRIVDKYN